MLRVLCAVFLLGAFDTALDTEVFNLVGDSSERVAIYTNVAIASTVGAIAGFVLAYFAGTRLTALAGCAIAAVGCALSILGATIGYELPPLLRTAGASLTSLALPVILGRAKFLGPGVRDGAFTLFFVARDLSSLAATPALAISRFAGSIAVPILATLAAGIALTLLYTLPRSNEPPHVDRLPPKPSRLPILLLAALAISAITWLSRRAMMTDLVTGGRMQWLIAGSATAVALGLPLAWRYYASPGREHAFTKIGAGCVIAAFVSFIAAEEAPSMEAAQAIAVFAGGRASMIVALPILTALTATHLDQRRALFTSALIGLAVNAGSAASNLLPESVHSSVLRVSAMVMMLLAAGIWRFSRSEP